MKMLPLLACLVAAPLLVHAEDSWTWAQGQPTPAPSSTVTQGSLFSLEAPRFLNIPGVMQIDLRSGVVKLDPKARTEPAEVAADFWKAVETIAGAKVCKP